LDGERYHLDIDFTVRGLHCAARTGWSSNLMKQTSGGCGSAMSERARPRRTIGVLAAEHDLQLARGTTGRIRRRRLGVDRFGDSVMAALDSLDRTSPA